MPSPSSIDLTGVLPIPLDGRVLEIFLERAGCGDDRQILVAATRGITELLGEQALCVLLEETPHVAFSTRVRKSPSAAIDLDRFDVSIAGHEEVPVDPVEEAHPTFARIRPGEQSQQGMGILGAG